MDKLPFETALQKLEEIVEAMESGDLPLETLLVRYEEGMKLAKACQGNVFGALIPHPSRWMAEECRVQVWKFHTDQWILLENEDGA